MDWQQRKVMGGPRGITRNASAGRPGRRGGFTLIELVVVIGIIILLIGITAPAVGPAMASNYRMQTVNALNSSLVTAQTYALSSTTDVALRIERATELNNYGRMIKPDGTNPRFRDFQQIRFVLFNKAATLSKPAFIYIKDSKITALPSAIWLAPTNFYTNDGDSSNDFGPGGFFPLQKGTTYLDPHNNGAASYCPFDTFYIVFSSNGLLKTWPLSPIDTKPLLYADETQQVENDHPPMLRHPQDSASGVLMYERKKLENAPNTPAGLFDFLRREAQALYINRFLGSLVESQ